MRIYPVEGRLVRDPQTARPLPPEGREVPDNDTYWQRRIRDGDVSVVQHKPATEA